MSVTTESNTTRENEMLAMIIERNKAIERFCAENNQLRTENAHLQAELDRLQQPLDSNEHLG